MFCLYLRRVVCGPHAEITMEREGGWERHCVVCLCECVCDAGVCRMYVGEVQGMQ